MAKAHETYRMLIVDDNAELIEILKEYLQTADDQIDGATHGQEALTKYGAKPYDIVITDLNMPAMSGIDLIKTLKREELLTEFIIITGYASLDTAIEAIKVGAFDYIVKPFKMEELQIVVKNVKEKIRLKRMNHQLIQKLNSFYQEIGRYAALTDVADSDSLSDTEQLIREFDNRRKYERNRLLIDES